MCSDEFKKKAEELTALLKASASDQELYKFIEQIVLNDPEYLCTEERTIKKLKLKLEPQSVDHKMMQEYLPEKWEIIRNDGRLLYSDEDIQKVIILLTFNIGVKKSLDVIPIELIERYLQQKVTKGEEEQE
ncbi:hypothetical protein [Rossellomorea sp. LjRoot5]|uniref:hypothetical protein n=1 Tax=Rossellomorea sp. LjRoot5 TaxID=3342331 RepID=UPI003ECF24A9